MTQDQAGQAPGADYVADDETDVSQTQQSGPVTRLKKVASALRGDRADKPVTDQTVPDEPVADQGLPGEMIQGQTVQGQTVQGQSVPDEMAMTSPERQGLNGSWTAGQGAASGSAPAADSMVAEDEMYDAQHAEATRPNATGPGREYQAEQDVRNRDLNSADPSVPGQGSYGTTTTDGTAPAPGYRDQGGTTAGYGSQAGTAAPTDTDPRLTSSQPGGTEAGTTDAGATGAGAVAGATAADATAADATGAGRHAAKGSDDGLRPGEATDRLGDFGDIAFGNLLPDAEQYTAQWQEIQFRFVDDPQASVTEAAEVIAQVTSRLEAAIRERQQAIEERQRAIQERASALRGRWGEGSEADTETLRETLRMYRVFMDQLVGPAK